MQRMQKDAPATLQIAKFVIGISAFGLTVDNGVYGILLGASKSVKCKHFWCQSCHIDG